MVTAPGGCPDWRYDSVPGYAADLQARHAALLVRLRQNRLNAREVGPDCRAIHRDFFADVAPTGLKYYAGNYRGSAFRCLKNQEVFVRGDPRVGAKPADVKPEMARLGERVLRAIRFLDTYKKASTEPAAEEARLHAVVNLVASLFQQFLTVHPFLDGNGHMGRFLVSLLLHRYGYSPTPELWRIDPRPEISGYSTAISAHRDGNTEPLERIILAAIIRGAA